MKAVLIPEPHKIMVMEVEMEKLQSEKDVLIRVKAGGICGSDMHGYHGTSPFINYPVIPGHEFAGEVVEVGKEVKDIVVGDHISVDPVISCGECYACKTGRYNVCSSLMVRGVHVNGGFKEYVSIPASACHKIDKHIPWEVACLVEPFTIASQSLARGGITREDIIYIAGAGAIGLTILLTAKSVGATVIIADISDEKLARAKAIGADYVINTMNKSLVDFIEETEGVEGITLALDAVGHPSIIEAILPNMMPTGRVVLLGFLKTPSNLIQMEVTKRELDVKGSRLSCNRFPIVVDCIEKEIFNPEKIISHRFNFTEIEEAIHLLISKPNECCKIVLSF
ncbi:zinc-binding alcohol dehydrogenase family protein [Cellulosilyticum sp. I15G10I2]|uniref:zinc-binding alcohol dehydrogenase family protein n=1 Tax=Cellulosilyticum sp. I15G10I2 TaxID=1892843 RepID=UPI00085CBD9E|nr:zinc-binding alcohol dehydrogenase family protein [Cellulosilyticum sp. I15G10I2]